jgi:hypothetical protein
MAVSKLLVVVPCGQSKIWKKYPKIGSEAAKKAYTGAPFKVNRAFAEKFGSKLPDRWVILSAKYGFIEPDVRINDYNVTFKKTNPKPISLNELTKQYIEKELGIFDVVIALGGEDYSGKVKEVFGPSKVIAPATGLPIGVGMGLVKKLTEMSKEEMLMVVTAKCGRVSDKND